MPYNRSGTKAIEAGVDSRWHFEKVFRFLLGTKTKLLPLSWAGSLTHTYALSVTIFTINCLIVAIFVNWKSRNVFVFFIKLFCLLIKLPCQNVIFCLTLQYYYHFCFKLDFCDMRKYRICDILYAFLFDVCNLRLGYLMILCIWKCVLLLLGWLFILSMDVWISTVSD